MQDLLLGTWRAQIVAYCRQDPLQALAAVLLVASIVMTLVFGTRGSGSGDTGGVSFGDGDGDGGGCGGD